MQTVLTDLGEGGLWLTITALAKREGIGKSAASEKVIALESDSLIKTKRGRGRQKLVNLAQYLMAIGKTGNAAQELAAETRAGADADDLPAAADQPTYRAAQTRKLQFEADLAELTLRQKLGELVPVADVEDAAAKVAEVIVRAIDRLATHAEAIAAAVGKDGVPGARAKLKEIAREIRTAAADAMTALATTPVKDSPAGSAPPAVPEQVAP